MRAMTAAQPISDQRDQLVPIDRDPVPGRYSDLVRRYYEQLGKDPAPRASADGKTQP